MIGFCTDSNAQLPADLAERFGVEIVPLTVTVDGRAYLEGVDLDADEFYASFRAVKPDVSTAAPSPGQFLSAYQRLASRGCDEILSVHVGSGISGTLNSARLGAEASLVPVRLVDTQTASFAVACCLWEAAEAVERGAGIDEAAEVAEAVAASTDNVFVVSALDWARRGGRLGEGFGVADHERALPVLRLREGGMAPVGEARSFEEAADVMAATVRASGTNLRVGIGVADAGATPLSEALDERLSAATEVRDVVRYRIAPSVAVHTGPGTAGAVWYPATLT